MIYQFKTNIDCDDCVELLTPYLDANNEISHWEIDMNSPDKVLTVVTDSLSDEMISAIVMRAGYKAQGLNQ